MKYKIGDKVYVDSPMFFEKNRVYTVKKFNGILYEFDETGATALPYRLTPVADPLADKILERNSKPEFMLTLAEVEEHHKQNGYGNNPIEPEHYNKGEIDLYESWYRTRPFNEFRAIMESIAERYIKRDKENRIQDLDKAIYTLNRLKEYEENDK